MRHNFLVVEAEAILGGFDIRFWEGSPNGRYTVKLGYLREINGIIPSVCQSVHPLNSWWKLVWNLNIP